MSIHEGLVRQDTSDVQAAAEATVSVQLAPLVQAFRDFARRSDRAQVADELDTLKKVLAQLEKKLVSLTVTQWKRHDLDVKRNVIIQRLRNDHSVLHRDVEFEDCKVCAEKIPPMVQL